jgi:hypothetical protein
VNIIRGQDKWQILQLARKVRNRRSARERRKKSIAAAMAWWVVVEVDGRTNNEEECKHVDRKDRNEMEYLRKHTCL